MNMDRKTSQGLRGVLRFKNGSSEGQIVKLRRDATIIGRDKGNVVIIDDTEASSTHCQIQKIGSDYHVFDMNSTNGTFVNGDRVVKAKLKPGDILTVGKTEFRFDLAQEAKLRNVMTAYQTASGGEEAKATFVGTVIEQEIAADKLMGIGIDIFYSDMSSENVVLPQRILYIGRSSPFGKFDRDPEISRKHMLVKLNDHGEIFIEDQGSTNGVFLNGKRITGMHKVSKADEVQIGANIKLRIKPVYQGSPHKNVS